MMKILYNFYERFSAGPLSFAARCIVYRLKVLLTLMDWIGSLDVFIRQDVVRDIFLGSYRCES